jgi:hypothetical protein
VREPAFAARSDDGRYYTAKRYPVPQAAPLVGTGRGTLAVSPGATSGTPIASVPVTSGAVTASVRAARPATLVGAPKVTLRYTATSTTPRTTIYAQLVNVRRQVVVGNNAVPIPLVSDGKPHTVSRDLIPIISTARRGDRYQLQLIAGTKQWVDQRSQATVRIASAKLRVPVAARGALTRR